MATRKARAKKADLPRWKRERSARVAKRRRSSTRGAQRTGKGAVRAKRVKRATPKKKKAKKRLRKRAGPRVWSRAAGLKRPGFERDEREDSRPIRVMSFTQRRTAFPAARRATLLARNNARRAD